jgi:undecaprenyl pyrophosphate phosphatase UppP
MPRKLLRGQLRFSSLGETERMAVLLIAATLPLAGAFFLKEPSELLSAYPAAVGVMLIVNGALLLLADRFSGKKGRNGLSLGGAFGVGIFQLLATFPGISR